MRRFAIALAGLALMAGACASSATRGRGSEEVLRLGVFPNLTHAPALVAVGNGIFDDVLAPTEAEVHVFNSGSDAGQAIASGSLDAVYIGPVPAATLFEQGAEVSVVSGAVHNGASLVVRTGAGIDSPEDLDGKKIAVPGIGNTQDVALRTWLHGHGLKARDEGGEVSVVAVDNTVLVQTFEQGQVDAAWEPEPWPSLLEADGLATRLVDESALWPDGRFPTTELVVSDAYRSAHPDVVRKLIQANLEALDFMIRHPEDAMEAANTQLEDLGAAAIPDDALHQAWDRLEFSPDPLAVEMEGYAKSAFALGVIETRPDNLAGIFALDTLNGLLEVRGDPPVSDEVEA